MFPILQIPKEADSYMSNLFSKYRTDILTLHTKQFKEEDIKGESTQQYIVQQYYLAFYYVLLIWYEVSEGIETTWSYYESKYDISNMRKKLACHNIDLDELLSVFGLPITAVEGVDAVGIEINEIVGESVGSVTPVTIDIQHLISVQTELNTLINLEDVYDYELDYEGEII